MTSNAASLDGCANICSMPFDAIAQQRITFELIRDHDPGHVDIDVIRQAAGAEVDVDVAVHLLREAGVVNQLGQRVSLSGAARRVLQLGV